MSVADEEENTHRVKAVITLSVVLTCVSKVPPVSLGSPPRCIPNVPLHLSLIALCLT